MPEKLLIFSRSSRGWSLQSVDYGIVIFYFDAEHLFAVAEEYTEIAKPVIDRLYSCTNIPSL